jgi:hypothetical protein
MILPKTGDFFGRRKRYSVLLRDASEGERLVSSNAELGRGPRRTSETKAKFIDLGLAESSIRR